MLSKYKLTRQIPLTTTYYNATNILLNPGKYAFAFYPTTGQGLYTNTNTTKGIMVSGAVDKNQYNGSLLDSIATEYSKFEGNCILRDMGKTIYTAYYTTNPATTTKPTKAYFRQVQLISPTSITANGWNGGPNGSTFGVTGFPSQSAKAIIPPPPPHNSTSYLTFYIPVTIANIVAIESPDTGAYAIAGGQV
jgi:hypothetical protein